MIVYRLDPIKMDDTSWKASSVKESVWVHADYEDSARDKVAAATAMALKPAHTYAPIEFQSPWYYYEVTSCKSDSSRADVPYDKPITADRRTLPR